MKTINRTSVRILGALLALTLLLPLALPARVAAGSPGFDFGFALPTTLVKQEDTPPQAQTWDIHLARNEMEGFQLIYQEQELAQREIRLTVTPFTHTNGVDTLTPALYQLVYIQSLKVVGLDGYVGDGYFYPDALLPLEGESVTAEQGINTAFYIEVKSAENAAAGLYTATVSVVNDADGTALFSAPVTAEVWNFTLPRARYSGTLLPLGPSSGWVPANVHILNGLGKMGWYNPNTGINYWTQEQQTLYKGYFDYLLDHGISGGFLPYDILEPEADAYLNDPRVKQFIVPFHDDVMYYTRVLPNDPNGERYQKIYADHLRAIAEKIRSNPVWERKAIFYSPSHDLPDLLNPNPVGARFEGYKYFQDMTALEKFNMVMTDLAEIWPGFHTIVPFNTGELAYMDLLKQGGNDIVTPSLEWCNSPDVVIKTKEWASKWWWVVGAPHPAIKANKENHIPNNHPIVEWERNGNWAPGLFLGARGYEPRTLFWQQFQYGMDGLFSWSSAYWEHPIYTVGNKGPWSGLAGDNDGTLLYPGLPVGRDPNTPIGSLRLKNLAAGLDDFDYLSMAKVCLGEEVVTNALRNAHANNPLYQYAPSNGVSGENYDAVRGILGGALSVTNNYAVTMQNDGNGTASASPANAAAGIEITLSATPNNGYQFKQWQVISGGVTVTANKFTMPAQAVTVKAIFEAIPTTLMTYAVTVQNDGNGTASANPATAVADTEITLTASPNSGYRFKEWQVVSGGVTITDNKFTMPAQAVTVKAIFEAIPTTPTTYAVTMQNDGNGTASANPANAATGTEITLTASPNSGYRFKEWQVVSGGVTVTANKFTMPAQAVTVKVIFEAIPTTPTTYAVTVQNDGNGTASANPATAAADTEITLTASPNSGYRFKSWQVISGGVTVTANKFIMPAQAVTVKAIFEAIPTKPTTPTTPTAYAVTVQNDGNGTASASPANAAASTEVTLTATPGSGYKFKEWQVLSGVVTITGGKFTMPAQAVAVKAIFELMTYPLTVMAGTGGSVSGAESGDYAEGTAVSVTATADSGYHFTSWTVDGATITDGNSANPATFAMPAGTVTLTANFEQDAPGTFAVTINGGTGSSSYAPGQTVTINANTPPAGGFLMGKRFKEWSSSPSVTFADKNSTATTFSMPSSDVTVTAVYEDVIRLWGKDTDRAANIWNWLLCIACFGWIWMAL